MWILLSNRFLIDFRLLFFDFFLQWWEIVFLPMAVNWVNYVDEMLIVNRAWSVTYQLPVVPVYAVPQWLLPNNIRRTVLHPAIVISQGKNLFYAKYTINTKTKLKLFSWSQLELYVWRFFPLFFTYKKLFYFFIKVVQTFL